jgi:hypothetical protein
MPHATEVAIATGLRAPAVTPSQYVSPISFSLWLVEFYFISSTITFFLLVANLFNVSCHQFELDLGLQLMNRPFSPISAASMQLPVDSLAKFIAIGGTKIGLSSSLGKETTIPGSI